MDDDSSDLSSVSSLSPALSLVDDPEVELKPQNGILKFFHKVSSDQADTATPEEPQRKRPTSPPHEHMFADNPDIAFIVMFRKRFDSLLPRSLAHFGPHEVEQDILQEVPGERIEHFLGALLAMLLNRKQDIKVGQYNSALHEALKEYQLEWPLKWKQSNPLAGEKKFATLAPSDRLDLMRHLIYWTLSHSEVIHTAINTGYNGKRTSDDLNQVLSVQPWGSDSDKRRYFLIEGENDSSFRVYRESNPAGFTRTWHSVAGDIDEVKVLADKLLTEDRGPNARKLSMYITKNIANFEDKEEKRKRRDYRRQQKERFRRPEPGFSMYEGRTRGKRIKYTYSDEEEGGYTEDSSRRSMRNTRHGTPTETGPVITASGRQSKPVARFKDETGGANNGYDGVEDVAMGDADIDGEVSGRPRRTTANGVAHNGYTAKPGDRTAMSSEDEEDSELDLGDDEDERGEEAPDFEEEDEDEDDDADEDDGGMDEDDNDLGDDSESPKSNSSRIVKLPIKVRFNKHGKAERLLGAGTGSSTPATSPPSRVASSSTNGMATVTPTSSNHSTNHDAIREDQQVGEESHKAPAQNHRPATPEVLSEKPHNAHFALGNSTPLGGLGTAHLAYRASPDKPVSAALPKAVPTPQLESANGHAAH